MQLCFGCRLNDSPLIRQDDFLLIHYDKGPCRNKLGHSRASVIWHRTQVRNPSFLLQQHVDAHVLAASSTRPLSDPLGYLGGTTGRLTCRRNKRPIFT